MKDNQLRHSNKYMAFTHTQMGVSQHCDGGAG